MKQSKDFLLNTHTFQDRCKSEGMEVVVEVYKLYRPDFLSFAKKYSQDRALLISVWHDAVIAFYQQALIGRYDEQKSAIKTYLFTIAKYKLFNELKKQKPTLALEDFDAPTEGDFSFLRQEALNEQARIMQKALQQLGEKCQQILTLFYYHEYSSEAIQFRMGYDNVNVVHSHKSRCLKQLRKIFKK